MHHTDLHEKLLRIPIVIAISAHFSIATEIFHGKNFRGATKNHENRETFLPRNFHGIRYSMTTVYTLYYGILVATWYCYVYSYSVALQYGMYIPLSKLWHGISNAYVIILLYMI